MSLTRSAWLAELDLLLAGVPSRWQVLSELEEHLDDAIDELESTGLSNVDAEREAIRRLGTPAQLATGFRAVRNNGPGVGAFLVEMAMANRVPFLGALWARRWLLIVPALLIGSATAVASSFITPRYEAAASLQFMPQQVSQEFVKPSVTSRTWERYDELRTQILSRTQLEKIINDFKLYDHERQSMLMQEIVERMRQDIRFDIVAGNVSSPSGASGINVSFVHQNPVIAMKVTEHLSSLVIEATLKDSATLTEGTYRFLEGQIEDIERRMVKFEQEMAKARADNGGQLPSRVWTIKYQVLQDTYKTLLIDSQQARLASNLERRQIGEQLRLLDPARLPNRPVGPTRSAINLTGTVAGLGLGLVLVAVSTTRRRQETATSSGM